MTRRRNPAHIGALSLLLLGSLTPMTMAGQWDLSGSIAGEVRTFPQQPRFSDQTNTTFSPS
ncbi:MAG: hypothetical protein VST68_09995, partial [Nitrospirota bacterium]|nr:hypothetical protein [Nitrospirota bacterium]